VVFEPDTSGDFREEGVVFAQADVQAGLESASALSYEDGTACHDVAVVPLYAQPLRIAVAAVP
jgi:hypothetical protein